MTTIGVRRAGWFCRSRESRHANATCDYVAKCKTFPVGLFPGDIPGSPRGGDLLLSCGVVGLA
jgi:hypothetical protein